jgi:MSHA type pilus biogenesis protein MshL
MLLTKNLNKFIIFICLILLLTSCAYNKVSPIDNKIGMTRDEVNNFLNKNPKEEKFKKYQQQQNEIPVPAISRMILTPPPPSFENDKIISFSVTDQVPLKDVLIELGRVAKIDIDLDSGITGGVVINAYNRPLKEVIERIAILGNLRYSYNNNILYFKRDMPYTKSYFVDFLIDGSLWGEMEANITAILKNSSPIDANSANGQASFSSNKSAGVIAIFANDNQHKEIAKYLEEVYKNSSAQVLIEAKVVEVNLNDEFRAGINWSWVNATMAGGATITNKTPISLNSSGDFAPFSLTLPNISHVIGGNINLTIQALDQFGVTRTISSPRINAMNNQKASLDFSETLVYFTLAASQTTTPATTITASTSSTSIQATKNEIPVGVQLAITPSINLRTSEITLDIKPKLTTDTGKSIKDPTILPIGSNGATTPQNQIPVVATRELNTIAKVKSGEVLVIGGLMQEIANNIETGIPFASKIPLFGNLFKSTTKVLNKVETVIFIKATIINNNNGVFKFDREFHDKFSTDNRNYLK